jgi:malonyl-ACP O-methyltransferase BioC
MNKNIIKKKFSKSIDSYNLNATIQRKITSKLIEEIKKLGYQNFDNILEIGCGTGMLTERLINNFNISHLTLNDIVIEYQDHLEKNILKQNNVNYSFLFGDAEQLKFPTNLDGIFSTSCIQWIKNIETFVCLMHEILNKNSIFAFSSFGIENFIQIKKLLNISLNYVTDREYENIFKNKFRILTTLEWKENLLFDDIPSILRHMKLTGVNSLNSSLIGKHRLLNFIKEYQNEYKTNNGQYFLTYNPVIYIMKKI